MITVNEWCAGGKGVGVSVQSLREMGKDFCPNFRQPFLEKMTEGAVTTEAGRLFQYFTTLTKMPTLSCSGGCHLGVHCWGTLLGRIEWEGGKTSSDQYPKGP